MGTNYYLHEKAACETCHRDFESRHIGKSSGGWCFTLHVIPEEGIRDLDDWFSLLIKPGAQIKDEYGASITLAEMVGIIAGRSGGSMGQHPGFDYDGNHAEPGPCFLVRHKIDGHCVKHGSGTWDCIVGEFS